ncbi:hypothetical protein JCM10212_004196 [Sporobolomyces blumeae]
MISDILASERGLVCHGVGESRSRGGPRHGRPRWTLDRRSISAPPTRPTDFAHPTSNRPQPATLAAERSTGFGAYEDAYEDRTTSTGHEIPEEMGQLVDELRRFRFERSLARSHDAPRTSRRPLLQGAGWTSDPSFVPDYVSPHLDPAYRPSIVASTYFAPGGGGGRGGVSSLDDRAPILTLTATHHDPIQTNPQALPLPPPPLEGEYVFPDSTGRASIASHAGLRSPPLVAATTTLPRPELASCPLPPFGSYDSSDRLEKRPRPGLSRISSDPPLVRPASRRGDFFGPARASPPPPCPVLGPRRHLFPSPPSGNLSTFAPSPRAVSPLAHD